MRRLVTLAVLGMLGAALLVSTGLAQQNASLGKDGAKDYNQQGTKIAWETADSTVKIVKPGQPLPIVDGDRDRDYGQILSTGITALSLATGATGISSLVDLRTYNHAVLMLSWDAADSANVALGVKIYNKQSSSWAADDTPVIPRHFPQPSALAADTTNALTFQLGGQLPRPTYYVFRNATAPVGNTYTLTALSRVPRIVPGASGCSIYLTPDCGQFAWWGMQITNANGNTVDQIKATLWVSR